eukprot:CAMPEP_0175882130 /NCGR_PEP_ID=MMETSP0107_2-20121207/43241_1 /TAXON_ID=195067 ORGANISM="Goniomonas pacifica, Strain CCMP1869" /NCGR_SAMPLE_ID=MMETSP0107_2 /ASSEMBLY_ACC=CAM_ASM_000203 /LENGTH=120 /DNA_ID=CAMNT_0017202029 /DNA_START=264 /DNA_END=626 /DNA_ORIENTATION=+
MSGRSGIVCALSVGRRLGTLVESMLVFATLALLRLALAPSSRKLCRQNLFPEAGLMASLWPSLSDAAAHDSNAPERSVSRAKKSASASVECVDRSLHIPSSPIDTPTLLRLDSDDHVSIM